MPKQTLEPAGDHIIVADTERKTTIDGIELAENVRQLDMIFGYVIAAGPDATRTKEQDQVCYGPYAGKMVALEGVPFRILKEAQIEAYIRQVATPEEQLEEQAKVNDALDKIKQSYE